MGITERHGQQDDGDAQQRHNESRTEMKGTELMSKPVDGGMMKERISMGPGRHGTDLEPGSIEVRTVCWLLVRHMSEADTGMP